MEKYDPVEVWLNSVAYSHSDSKGTRINYRKYFEEFCDFIERSPEKILKEAKGSNYLEFQSEYARLAQTFIGMKWNEGYAPNTLRGMATAIQSFFKHSKLPLAYIVVPRSRTVFHNRAITKGEIISIQKVARPRDKAFFSVMIHSGLRPETLCKLQLRHIQPDFGDGVIPCCIKVPEEYSKGQYGAYFSFMGEEAVERLKAYFTTRREMTEDSYLFVTYGTGEPVSPKSFSAIFSRLSRKLRDTGVLDFKGKTGKPAELRLYNLRKFFRKYAGHAGIEYVNFWMGHKTDYKAEHIPSSDTHYFDREDVEFHRKLYAEKAMPSLRIDEKTPRETEKLIKEQAAKIEELGEKIKNIKKKETEIQQLRKEMEELKENTAKLQGLMDFIDEHDLLKESDTLAAIIDLLAKKEKMKKDKEH